MSETYSPDNLIAGDFPVVSGEEIIVSSESLSRGAILGKITSGGKYKLTNQLSSDGSENPKAILAKNTDASGGDVTNTPVYLSGEYNQDVISLGGTTTAASVKDALRALSIYLKAPVVD